MELSRVEALVGFGSVERSVDKTEGEQLKEEEVDAEVELELGVALVAAVPRFELGECTGEISPSGGESESKLSKPLSKSFRSCCCCCCCFSGFGGGNEAKLVVAGRCGGEHGVRMPNC